jgi:hypothetical protein
MSNKQLTAVQWYAGRSHDIERLLKLGAISIVEYYEEQIKAVQQAKEMEKKQHKKTWLDSTSQFDNAAEMTFKKDFDDHYNETYGGGEQ